MKFFAAFSYSCKSPGGALATIRKQQYRAIFMYKVRFIKLQQTFHIWKWSIIK